MSEFKKNLDRIEAIVKANTKTIKALSEDNERRQREREQLLDKMAMFKAKYTPSYQSVNNNLANRKTEIKDQLTQVKEIQNRVRFKI